MLLFTRTPETIPKPQAGLSLLVTMVTTRKPVPPGAGGCLSYCWGHPNTNSFPSLEAPPGQRLVSPQPPQCPSQWLCSLHQTGDLPFYLPVPCLAQLAACHSTPEAPSLEPAAESGHILRSACDLSQAAQKGPHPWTPGPLGLQR